MRAARKFLHDERGTAVVEFAFVLPLMLVLFIGAVELTTLLRLDRKVVAAAQTAADLVTQRREVSDAQLNDILKGAELILEPFPTAPHSVAIVGIRFDPNTGNPTVDWTKSKNGGTAPNATTLATGLGDPGEGVVVVRVSYAYTPVFFNFLLDSTTIEETAVLRPRRSSFVEGP